MANMEAVSRSMPEMETLIPRWCAETGSLGSDVFALRGGNPRVLKALVVEVADRFRKCWYDLTGGVAVFVVPSFAHESTSAEARDLVKALCRSLSLAVVEMASTTTQSEDETKRVDPDQSFLIGERAERYLKLRDSRGLNTARASVTDQPPDLAIEVEHTHHDPQKVAVYQAAGVKELWDLATDARRHQPVIYDLQAEGGPRSVAVSQIVPGVHTNRLPAALTELWEIGGYGEFMVKIGRGEAVERRLLTVARDPHQAPS